MSLLRLASRGTVIMVSAAITTAFSGQIPFRPLSASEEHVMRIVSESQLQSVLSGVPGPPRVVVSGNFATPWPALALLDAVIPGYRLFAVNAQAGFPDRPGVILESPFVGPGMRGKDGLRYFPCRLSLVPSLLKGPLPPDVVLIQTTRPSAGTVSLGLEVNILPAAIEAARARGGLVVAQLNPQMPYTSGDAVLALDDIDYAIEADVPLPGPAPRPVPEVFQSIGERVAALVPPAATLQLGIGAVPDAVLAALTGRRGLGVWSEMFSDGVLALERAGALDPVRPVTASFAFGTAELRTWMDRNPRVRMLRTEKTNDPGLIARHPRMFSLNSALQVDLFGQANAARVHGTIYSGFGGQTDFVVGALHSPGGRAIIALPSWHPRAGVSTVVPRLAGPVTSFQHSFIVSEQGAAAIWGHDAATQAGHIISQVAHPSVRDELREAGRGLGFLLR
jgi:acyl-CoA hydrolase